MSIRKLTALAAEKCPGVALDAWLASGWTEGQLIQHGYLRIVSDEVPTEPALPTVAEAKVAYEEANQKALLVYSSSRSEEERTQAHAHSTAAFEALRQARVRANDEAFDSGVRTATGLVGSTQQLEHFMGCMYVQDLHGIIVPGLTDVLDQMQDFPLGDRLIS